MKEVIFQPYHNFMTGNDFWIAEIDGRRIGSILKSSWSGYYLKYMGDSIPSASTLEEAKQAIINLVLHDEQFITNKLK